MEEDKHRLHVNMRPLWKKLEHQDLRGPGNNPTWPARVTSTLGSPASHVARGGRTAALANNGSQFVAFGFR